jgi:hypothetical protein
MNSIDKIKNRLTNLSDGAIKDLYASVEKAFEHDASLSQEEKEMFQQFGQDGVYYGTEEFPDWPIWRDALKQELTHRRLEG